MLRIFEAFAGYGSQSIALRNLGVEHEVVAISEIDKYALKAYYALHDESIPNLGDISKIKIEDVPEHDLFTYSFPCQDISVAGKQKGIEKGKTRSGLLYECERIIENCKPKYLLLENVKNLVGKKHKPHFDEWLEYLESLGYTNYWQVLNVKDYGVPQNRERVFVISILGEHEHYEFPKPIKLEKRIKDILEDEVEEKFYINRPWKFVEGKGYQGEFLNGKFEQNKRIYSENNKTFRTLGAAERGQNNIIIKARLENINYKQINKILGVEGVCATLDTMQGGYREPKILEDLHTEKISEYKVRKLTPRECFRLMGLKDDDIDKIQATGISNTQQYKMAGNSIVVNVLEAIFKNLF